MKWVRKLKRAIKRCLPSTTVIKKVPVSPGCVDRLQHVQSLGFNPQVIYDCGAFTGRWAREVNALFPSAKVVLVEPNRDLFTEIRSKIAAFEQLTTLLEVAVGEIEDALELNIWDDARHASRITAAGASSLLRHVQGEPAKKLQVRVCPIDAIVEETGLRPDLLKLDLQGAELPALKGALRALDTCELCIIEFGCLDAYEERTTPADLFDIMDSKGFKLYDIVDIRYRPYDGALCGGDFFFVRADSALKAHRDYF